MGNGEEERAKGQSWNCKRRAKYVTWKAIKVL